MAGRTTIVIAHRLSTLALADEHRRARGRAHRRAGHPRGAAATQTPSTARSTSGGARPARTLVERGTRDAPRARPSPPALGRAGRAATRRPRSASCRRLAPLLPRRTPAAPSLTVVLMLVVTASRPGRPGARQGRDRRRHRRRRPGRAARWRSGCSCGAGLIGWLAGYHQTYLSSWVGERVLLDLRTDTFRAPHAARARLPRAHAAPARIVSRLTNDIEALEQLVTDGVTSLVVNGLTLVGVVDRSCFSTTPSSRC